MKFNEFKKEVIAAYGKYFNGSICNVIYYECLGRSIWIDCYIAARKEEFPYGIERNDMMKVSFRINLPSNHEINDELPDLLIMEVVEKCYALKPAPSSYFAFDIHSMPYRKTKGTADKLIKQLDKNFSALHDAIAADLQAGRIHDKYIMIVKRHLA